MTNAMSSGAANAGIRYRGPGTSLSGSAYWMTIAARTARVAGQRGSPPLGRADHGRCGWVLPSGGRGRGVLGMGLLRSLGPPAAVDGRGAATGSSGQCPAPAAALGAAGWWGARSGYRRAQGSWAAVLVPGGAPAAGAGPGAPAPGTTPSVRIAAQRAPAWASSQSTVDPTPSTGWSASASGTVTNVTLAGSSPLSPVASSRRSTTDSPLSVVDLRELATGLKGLDPAKVTFVTVPLADAVDGVVGVGQRHGDERDLGRVQPLEPGGQLPQVDHRQSAVGGDRLGGGVEEGQQPVRAQQQSDAGGLAQDGGDELLLALDAAQVAAVAEGVPGAHERQRLLAVDVAHPGRQ